PRGASACGTQIEHPRRLKLYEIEPLEQSRSDFGLNDRVLRIAPARAIEGAADGSRIERVFVQRRTTTRQRGARSSRRGARPQGLVPVRCQVARTACGLRLLPGCPS